MLAALLAEFQSTLPTRGSDAHKYYDGASPCAFQSTLPTRGSDNLQRLWSGRLKINFNPRSPRGGATPFCELEGKEVRISIHAPHEGERRLIAHSWYNPSKFQSTLPTRGSDALTMRRLTAP